MRPNWGVLAGKFGEAQVYGLQGYAECKGYAFAMNTFNAAGALAPAVTDDHELSKPIAKWLLHVANNSRLFFPDEVPVDKQSNPELKDSVLHCVPYEGVREECRTPLQWNFVGTSTGSVKAGKGFVDGKETEIESDRHGMMSALFEIGLPKNFVGGTWRIEGRVAHAASLFHVSTANAPVGPWKNAGGFPEPCHRRGWPLYRRRSAGGGRCIGQNVAENRDGRTSRSGNARAGAPPNSAVPLALVPGRAAITSPMGRERQIWPSMAARSRLYRGDRQAV